MKIKPRRNLATLPPLTPALPESAFSMEQQHQIDGLRATLESLERRYNSQERFVRTLKKEVQVMHESIAQMRAPLTPSHLDRPARKGQGL